MTEDRLYTLRHSAAHMLAAAVVELYPGTKLGTGPVVENGFYYDLLPPDGTTISEANLPKIEVTMRAIISGRHRFSGKEVTPDEAQQQFNDQPFKQELIKKLNAEGKSIRLYESGPFVDLCAGGHIETTSELEQCGLKLTKIAGAYWQADASRPQMTRIYGVLFPTQTELAHYLQQMSEAEQRDHRKLGKELGLFTIIDDVGPGLPLFYPDGATMRRIVEQFIAEENARHGYIDIWIPHIAKGTLYRTSGHLGKYPAMFPPMKLEEQEYYLKPMNCPHFMMLYKSEQRSYRDLPIRWTCTTTVYRTEKSGELSGLTRVRSITQDDCHVFMREDQIEEEVNRMLDFITVVYKAFGLDDFWVSISTRDPKDHKKYLGKEERWDKAERILQTIVERRQVPFKVLPGEAAFYGPKLDFFTKDAIGREWQLSTVQLDFNLPERFTLKYTASDGSQEQPVVIHRAVLGSTERWLGIMIEHFAGNFPVWLAPVQVQLIPVGRDFREFAHEIADNMRASGIRTDVDDADETVGNKTRKALKRRIPYLLVIGEKEKTSGILSLRRRDSRELQTMPLSAFVTDVTQKIAKRALTL